MHSILYFTLPGAFTIVRKLKMGPHKQDPCPPSCCWWEQMQRADSVKVRLNLGYVRRRGEAKLNLSPSSLGPRISRGSL